MRKVLYAITIGALLSTAALLGQTITSSLVGTVRDASGAVVPGAVVSVINLANNSRSQTKSDASGAFVLLQLTPGSYNVEVEGAGFRKYLRKGMLLELQQQANLDVSLEVGAVSDTLTVTGDAPSVDTTTSAVGDLVNNTAILNLPLNTRNVYSLIFLTPGLAGSVGNDYNSLSFSVNGARNDSMEVLVDGATGGFPTVNGYFGIGAFPPVDAVGEFKMLDENYPAEFGRSLGNVVNIIYKSGTNGLHGTAFEFLRNSALDSNTFFSNRLGVALPSFKRSQYGGVVDGPIRKNKTFFLFAIEALRQNQFQSTTADRSDCAAEAGRFLPDSCVERKADPDVRPVLRGLRQRRKPDAVRQQRDSNLAHQPRGRQPGEVFPTAEHGWKHRHQRQQLLPDRGAPRQHK